MINYSLLDEAFPNDEKLNKKSKRIDKDKDKEKKEIITECKSIQAPIYTIPMTCDNTKLYNDIIDISSNKNNLEYSKDGIKAYDFDEMDAYLNIADIKTNTPKKEELQTMPFLDTYLKSLKENFKTQEKKINIEHFTNNEMKVDVNLYNLFLFMFLGIIIILLIDQITKLVTNS
jgi:hypothetical protein